MIEINVDNASFHDVGLLVETQRVLQRIGVRLPLPTMGKETYLDINGNTCASAEWMD